MSRKFTTKLTLENAVKANEKYEKFCKTKGNFKEGDYFFSIEAQTTTELCNYVGQIEDLEEKLGIDLITLFGLVDKEVYWNDGDLTRKLLVKLFTFVGNKIRVYIVDDGLTMYLPIEDFNRYVFLTEEEAKKHLENINGRS